ncbi:hypothetical protein MSG28_009885 [Choristoneura fumiferana]|uniref:Uncharacterized protein n=1 Tax=Choristoneura fumiferana TaxID=7141 RepID=A0ACC0JD65_CHOFU|nr:hypothetical protein MSG28_009885 [Choristoneura fumiferana]
MEEKAEADVMNDEWRTRGGSIWNQNQNRQPSTTRVKCRATTCQLVQLVKFMEKHKELAVSHAQPFPGSDQLWEQLADHINQFGPPKNPKQCKTLVQLVKFMEKHKELAVSHAQPFPGSDQLWVQLADHINQFGPPKNPKQCKTTWRDLRKRAFAMMRTRNKDKQKSAGRNLYGMAPKIISLIAAASGLPKAGVSGSYSLTMEGKNILALPRPKRKKLTLTLGVKNEIIKRIDQGESYGKLSTEFGIGRATIYDICKNRTKIEKAAKKPHTSNRRTLRTAENPVLEDKLYEWYMAERCLYNINGPLMALKAKMIHKELTGKDDFLASSGWLDRFKKRRGIVLGTRGLTPAAEAGSSKVVPLEVPVVDKSKEQGVIKVERTSSGDQLVIRVTDKQNSKSNVFNSFSVNDGHFENNIVVKEEREEPQTEEEESEAIETEEERRDSVSEALFPAAEALLGNQESSREDVCKALKVCVVTIEMDWRAVEVLDWKLRIGKRSVGCPPTRWTDDLDLNQTLQRFVSEYAERTILQRERLELERARFQFDMEVFHRKKKKPRK